MNNLFLRNTIRFFLLIFVQVLIIDNLKLEGYVNPYLYIYFILLLPYETPKWLLLASSFLIGFSVDIFSNSGGIHAAASTFIAFIRPGIISITSTKDQHESGTEPSVKDLGLNRFFLYAAILTLAHHFILFYIEVFRFTEFFRTFIRVLASSAATISLVLILEYTFKSKTQKRGSKRD